MCQTINGPDGTPYTGGTFHVDITIPSDYPFSPPKMKFITKCKLSFVLNLNMRCGQLYFYVLYHLVWHPNVSSQTGAICLDILKDQWSPALTIKTALISLQALMCR